MSNSNCSILRIGPIDSDDGHAAALRSAITRHFRQTTPLSPSHSPSNDHSHSNLLTISNKYFDANILLLDLHESSSSPNNNNHSNNDTTEESIRLHQEDGMLLIFNNSLLTTTTITTLSTIHNTASQNKTCGELLRLCIGTTHGPSPLSSDNGSSNSSKLNEEEYSRRVLWCLDHGYEYVEVDVTAEGMTRGFEERDKEGFARVIEAINCCMWSSHVMKERRIVGAGAGAGSGSGGDGTVGGNGIAGGTNNVSKNEEEGVLETTCVTNNATSTTTNGIDETKEETTKTKKAIPDAEREKAAMASLLKNVVNGNDKSSSTSQPPTDKPSKEDTSISTQPQQPQPQNQKKQQEHAEEISLSQLESVLSEAKQIRQASQTNSISDEERRERAADTALKLMGLLDSLGFDDDESEEEEDCCSSDDEKH